MEFYYRYRCNVQSTFYNGKHYRYNELIDILSDTAPEGFVTSVGEEHKGFASWYTDRDNTLRFGEDHHVWKCETFPATQDKQGQTDKPDYDYDQMGLLFPQNDPTEIAYISTVIPIELCPCAPIKPLVIFLQTSEDVPVFKIDFRYTHLGNTFEETFVTVTTVGEVFPYTEGTIVQALEFEDVFFEVGPNRPVLADMRMYRDDDIVTGDVLFKELAVFYQADSIGTGRPFQR